MTDIRLLFVLPCGIHITGKPHEAKADMECHRRNCDTCNHVSFVNRLDLIGRNLVKRESLLTRDEEPTAITLIILHSGIIPPGNVVRQMVNSELPRDTEHPELWRLEPW